jgi:hypothetical protein
MSPLRGLAATWEPTTNTSKKRNKTEVILGQWGKTGSNDISPESIAKWFTKCDVSINMN